MIWLVLYLVVAVVVAGLANENTIGTNPLGSVFFGFCWPILLLWLVVVYTVLR